MQSWAVGRLQLQGRASLLDHRARRTCRVENDLPTFVRNESVLCRSGVNKCMDRRPSEAELCAQQGG